VPGMNSGLSPADPTIVAAFRSALIHQWAIVALIFVLLLVGWGATRSWAAGHGAAASAPAAPWREPRARRLLRIGFGALWVFDGILQAQPQMAGGLPQQVIEPAASSSPAWVQHLVNAGGTIWTYHPIQAGAASVWIQVGIGMWLIFGARGWPSRLGGLASVAWGLIVWAFGEAFGSIFAPGLTVLFGAPGAVLIYVVAGALIALPERAWESPRIGRLTLGGMGVFFLGMALLQAWPGRGFWQGTLHGQPGTLAGMIQSMAGTSQPHVLSSIVSAFGNFTAAHGFAVNLVAVTALAVIGAGFCVSALRGDARLARIAVIVAAVFCLADWVLIEDLGFLGGLGTDPNSMIPLILLFAAGYLALTPTTQPEPAAQPEQAAQPAEAAGAVAAAEPIGAAGPAAPADEAAPAPTAGAAKPDATAASEATAAPDTSAGPAEPVAADGATAAESGTSPPSGLSARLAALRLGFASLSGRSVAALGAIGVIVVGAAPMAFASVSSNADPILAQAISGGSAPIDTPAPGFTLTSQDGRQVSLSSLRGKVVLLTFLDPVCTTDCPIIAQEFRAADAMLGAKSSGTELVAVVANPTYTSTSFTQAFTKQEGLDQVPNWLYLTGSLNQLAAVWRQYGIEVENLPAGAMSAHNDLAFVISASGRLRQEFSDDPGPATSATKSSFAGLLASSVLQVMG
jgi:cytochrome oxidase Cu insertion factor (SCO1/SenC/PrrC family)